MPDPRPEEDDQLLWLLGMICVKWAHLEDTVDTGLLDWMGNDPLEYAAITAHMSTKDRFDAARSLIDLRLSWSELNDELERLAEDLAGLTLERNRFIHGQYVQSHQEVKSVPYDEMRQLSSKIVQLQGRIRAALERAALVRATR